MKQEIKTWASKYHQILLYYKHKLEYIVACNASIFDVDKIPQQVYPYRDEIYDENAFYGIEKTLRKYAGINKPLNAIIEHGISDCGSCENIECSDLWKDRKEPVITFGEMRKDTVTKAYPKVKVIDVGPYVAYAQSALAEEETENLKSKYGRILTLYPMHSIENFEADYEYDFKKKQLTR